MSWLWLHIAFLFNPPEIEIVEIKQVPVWITVTIRDSDMEGPIKRVYPLVIILTPDEFRKRFGPFTPQDLFELRRNKYIREEITLAEYLF